MRIVPSDIVGYIDELWKGASDPDNRKPLLMSIVSAPNYAALLRLLDHVALEGHVIQADNLAKLEVARHAIEAALHRVMNRGRGHDEKLYLTHYNTGPVPLIREVMASVPDHVVPEEVTGLEFIKDEALRTDLRADIASVERLLQSGEWKAATVIAGSVMEALLLHALLEHGQEAAKERAANLDPPVTGDPAHWHLPDYVKVAEDLDIITQACAKQASIAGDCRNLIHPGKQYREGRKVTRKDAYSAVAGLQHVVEAIAAWWETRVGS